jgi:hypothetical protein
MFVSNIGLISPVPSGATGISNVINTNGLNSGSVGLISDHAGTLSVQRFIDATAQVPIGSALTQTLVANTPNSVSWGIGLASAASTAPSVPIGSIIVSFINSPGAVANLTSVTVLLSP